MFQREANFGNLRLGGYKRGRAPFFNTLLKQNAHGGICRRVPNIQFSYVSTLAQRSAARRRRRQAGRIPASMLCCRSSFGAAAGSVHGALQDSAMLVHLAQLALGVHFVPAMYQQVIHNQPTARAYAESVFYDHRRRHKLLLIQEFNGPIPYAFDQFNANL